MEEGEKNESGVDAVTVDVPTVTSNVESVANIPDITTESSVEEPKPVEEPVSKPEVAIPQSDSVETSTEQSVTEPSGEEPAGFATKISKEEAVTAIQTLDAVPETTEGNDNPVTETPKEDPVKEVPKTEAAVETPALDSTPAIPETVELIAEADPAEVSKSEADEKKYQPKLESVAHESNVTDVTPDPPKLESVAEVIPKEALTEAVCETPVVEVPKEDPMVEVPRADPPAEPPKAEPVTKDAGVEPLTAVAQIELAKEASEKPPLVEISAGQASEAVGALTDEAMEIEDLPVLSEATDEIKKECKKTVEFKEISKSSSDHLVPEPDELPELSETAQEVDPLASTEDETEPESDMADTTAEITTESVNIRSPDVNVETPSIDMLPSTGGSEVIAPINSQVVSAHEIMPEAMEVSDVGGIAEFTLQEETVTNMEVMDVAGTEDGQAPAVREQEEVTSGGMTDSEEKENGDENNLGLEGFADENETEGFVEITRRRVSQDGNCYCGKERNLNIAELLCASCNRWYHESCIGYQLGKLVPFMTNYVFICKNCSPSGLESFKRSSNQAQFPQLCVTALANLTQACVKDGTNRKIFSKDKDIIPFFEMHWEGMTKNARRLTQSWHSTVTKTLQKEVGTLFTFEEALNDPDAPHFGLLCPDLTQIRPNYDAMIKTGQLKVTDLGVHQSSNSALAGRGTKRRQVDTVAISQASVAKKSKGDVFISKPVGHGYPVDHPYNKDGYRYILAEPDPYSPFRQEFDENSEWGGRPIPGWLYRVLNPCSVLLALHDRAPQLRVSEDRLSVTGEKGYCMIRATHGVSKGSWYWEAKITDQPEGSHTRIGFSQVYGNLQGPLGYDRYGYSWRSRMGTKFHQAVGKSYCKGGYTHGDVIGFLIIMPDTNPNAPAIPPSYKDRPLVRFKSHLYYEDKDEKRQETDSTIRPSSKIICFKNGECVGVAYENLFEGVYYPSVSLYKSCTVNVNFGPDFWSEPDQQKFPHKGMFERAESAIVEQTVSDLHFLTEHHGKLRLENAVVLPQ